MKDLIRKIENFIYRNNHRGVSNLMLFIAVCNVFVYFVTILFEPTLMSWLAFDAALVMKGQVWRLFTFIFIPIREHVILVLISCYFYYWVGRSLEHEWGKLKFNTFYLSGMLLNIIFFLITGGGGDAMYLNFSLFLAYATLFPDRRILLFFIIPIKVKYIAYVQVGWYALEIILNMAFFPFNLLPLIALLNYVIFFRKEAVSLFRRNTVYAKKRATFRSAVNQARKRPEYDGYVHKCAACGLTDTADPNMEFRYCSLCAHYECYCSQHIFTHDHVK